jgi:hypothetical protein
MQLAQCIYVNNTQMCGPLPADTKFNNLGSIVSAALTYVFPVAGVMLLVYLLWGGFDYLTSMGDPKKAEGGRNKITNAVIGFIIIFAAYWIVQLVDYVFHFGIYTTHSPA